MSRFELHHGDALEVLSRMPDSSMDSIICDPPYGLSFMGRKWDYDVPSVDIWAECLRVLKPGGHLLAFAGTRTQHRMAVRIEDAGFEIRDMIAWVYGSGFPKSMDVSKAIDKAAGAEREVTGEVVRAGCRAARGGAELVGSESAEAAKWKEVTLPATDAARQWQGWGTALKPALEPITVARKPLIGTVAENVLAHGTGALHIDACRVPTDDDLNGGAYSAERQESASEWASTGSLHKSTGQAFVQPAGRWPANLVHDGSDQVLAQFPAQAGAKAPVTGDEPSDVTAGIYGSFEGRVPGQFLGDAGSAARFFYCPKASRRDRNEGVGGSDKPAVAANATMREREEADWPARNGNHHPTVKPTDLMAWLCRLVTPPGGLVLDPFMGSGSTGKAAIREGFRFVGIELDEAYVDIARARISHAAGVRPAKVVPAPVADANEAGPVELASATTKKAPPRKAANDELTLDLFGETA